MLKFEDSANFAMELYYVEIHKSCLYLNEYSMLTPTATRQNDRQTDLALHVGRKATYWMISFVGPLALLKLCSLLVFVLSAFDISDRMSVSFTFLLTVVSFRALLGSMLPRLGYFTLMDHYINASTLFSFFIAVASSLVVPVAQLWRSIQPPSELALSDETHVQLWDRLSLGLSLCVYLTLHMWLASKPAHTRRFGKTPYLCPAKNSGRAFNFKTFFFTDCRQKGIALVEMRLINGDVISTFTMIR